MYPPKLTPEQRKEGLEKALKLRRERAELKKNLKRGKISLKEVLEMSGQTAERIKAKDILTSLPGVGKITADKIMNEVKIAASRRVKGLGVRQTKEILSRFS
ncbi:MAG: integration host factor [Actinobacteria bacterium]|nr:integration host factor [Actinomycetota bacterium]